MVEIIKRNIHRKQIRVSIPIELSREDKVYIPQLAAETFFCILGWIAGVI